MLDRIRAVAAGRDATPTQVSLAWLLAQDVVTAPIVGPKTIDQLHENLGALDVTLSPEEIDRIAEPKTPRYPKA